MTPEQIKKFQELDSDIEGVVIRFDDGHMVKIKLDRYIAIHKAKENILFEKNVIKLILEEKIDDVFADLPLSDQERVSKYKESLLEKIHLSYVLCEGKLAYWEKQQITRKEFVERGANSLGPRLRPILLKCYHRKDLNIREEIVKMILKYCTSQSKLEEIREDFLPQRW